MEEIILWFIAGFELAGSGDKGGGAEGGGSGF